MYYSYSYSLQRVFVLVPRYSLIIIKQSCSSESSSYVYYHTSLCSIFQVRFDPSSTTKRERERETIERTNRKLLSRSSSWRMRICSNISGNQCEGASSQSVSQSVSQAVLYPFMARDLVQDQQQQQQQGKCFLSCQFTDVYS